MEKSVSVAVFSAGAAWLLPAGRLGVTRPILSYQISYFPGDSPGTDKNVQAALPYAEKPSGENTFWRAGQRERRSAILSMKSGAQATDSALTPLGQGWSCQRQGYDEDGSWSFPTEPSYL